MVTIIELWEWLLDSWAMQDLRDVRDVI
jgi:hypothetical protein